MKTITVINIFIMLYIYNIITCLYQGIYKIIILRYISNINVILKKVKANLSNSKINFLIWSILNNLLYDHICL